MNEHWWSAAIELPPGQTGAKWPNPPIPRGATLRWRALALKVKFCAPDLGGPSHDVLATAELLACVRENSIVRARIGEEAVLVIRADEIPSGHSFHKLSEHIHEHPTKDVSLGGVPLRVEGDDLAFDLVFDDSELVCRCNHPHDKIVTLELFVYGTIVETA